MTRRLCGAVGVLAATLCFGQTGFGQTGSGQTGPGQTMDLPTELGPPGSGREPAHMPLERIDDNRYRIGAIELDKAAKSFSVPGRVIHDQPPLKFLIVLCHLPLRYHSPLVCPTMAAAMGHDASAVSAHRPPATPWISG